MTSAVVVLVALAVLGLLAGAHLYLWRRFVRDVTAPGSPWRRVGAVAAVVLPLTSVGALVAGRSGVPFAVEQALAWPGYLWLACLLYLLLALLAGELVRWVAARTPWGVRRRTATATGPAPQPPAPAEAAPAGAATGTTDAAGTVGTADAADTAGTVTAAVAGGGAPDGATAAAPGPTDAAPHGTDRAADRDPEATAGPRTGSAPQPEGAGSLTVPLSAPLPGRRVFLARTLAVTAATVGLGTTAAGAWSVLKGPTLKKLTVPLAKLGRRAHGYRIAVVSDIHLGPTLGRAHTRRIVETINRTQPDLITIVGDLADGTVADLGPAAEPLRELRSRHGAYFVTGNHEYFGDAHAWLDHLRELGVHPLENARRELPGFDLAGVNDIQGEDQGEGPDYAKALGDRDTARPVVLMAHQPVMVHEAVEHGVDLQLSGHTHGGQLWPGPYLAALANPTVAGLDRYGDTQLYVTRGAGAWGPPVRVGAESDITVVTLASGD
ncbi:metallophosphoesterase [Streptomyces sp. SID1143]|uniref:metallophosphoesterase n=1 Tax=Streptomyces sp. SID1143 TaxID=3425889 RepID=UPI0040560C2A